MPCIRHENVRHATLLFCAEGVNVRTTGAGGRTAEKMDDKFCKKLIKVVLSRFTEMECADMFSNIQRMAEDVHQHLKQVECCDFDDAQRYLHDKHGAEYNESGVLADDIVIAVAILINKGVADVDGENIKLLKETT